LVNLAFARVMTNGSAKDVNSNELLAEGIAAQPPVETPPDQPGLPEGEPTPTPIGDPVPNEPTRLV
jgi:hypothetical protein